MTIMFKPIGNSHKGELAVMSEEAEQNYLSQFNRETEEYVKEAKRLTSIEDGFVWTDLDDFVVSEAKAANARRGKIVSALGNPLSPLRKVAPAHKPLTDELTQERKDAMMEAAAIIRGALGNFTGEVRKQYEEAAERLEREAAALKTHTGEFNASRYGLGSHYASVDPVTPGAWTGRSR